MYQAPRKVLSGVIFSLLIIVITCGVGLSQAPQAVLPQPDNGSNHTQPSSPAAVQGDMKAPTPFEASLYKISAGDTLDIGVFGAPELSQKVRVTNEGQVYLPLVNYVQVGGLDVQQAQAAIEQALKKGNFMVSPHVTVLVSEYASGVVLMGEVVRPGVYPVIAGKAMLFDILTQAGGPTPNAGQLVSITHRGETQPESVYLSHDPTKAMEANVAVRQGDTIMVSKAATIFVVGEVLQPSAFLMESRSGYTALKALAMAHGPTRVAKLSQAKIIRQTPTGVQEIPVPLDKIAQSKVPDTELMADDILVVPVNHGKVAAAQAISMAQSIAVLGVARTW